MAIIAATVPSIPLNVRKDSATTGIITIVWDLPDTDGDSIVLDYEVYWDNSAEDGNYSVVADSTGNALTFTTSSPLHAGNSYTFLVKALNAVGASSYSDALVVIAGTIPSKTPTPEKFEASVDSIEIRWSAPSDGGSAIIDYGVFWDNGIGGGVFIYTGSTDGYLTFTVPVSEESNALIAGRTYEFKVSALNAVGVGEQSDAIAVIAASKPDQPPTPNLVYQSPT